MSIRKTFLAVLSVTVAAGCGGSAPATLDTDAQKASYAIGLDMGGSLEPAADHVDLKALMKGIEDALADRDPAIEEDELRTVMTAFNETVRTEQAAKLEAQAEENLAAGAAYIEENGGREGVIITESGLQYEVLREGEGPSPESGQRVTINYRGTLPNGTEFDSSYDKEPATFAVDQVIPGFTEALKLMSVGSHFRIVLPSDLAYGAQGQGRDIGPNQALIFELELLGIE